LQKLDLRLGIVDGLGIGDGGVGRRVGRIRFGLLGNRGRVLGGEGRR